MKSTAHRAVAVLAVTVGVGLVIVPFALQLWDRTPAAERTFDRFDFLMTDNGLRQAGELFDTTRAGGLQLVNGAAPGIAEQLDMTPGQFRRYTQRHFPAVAKGLEETPQIVTLVAPIVDGLANGGDEYASAKSIPGLGLPLTSTPWLAIGLGMILIGGGTFALVAPGRRTTAGLFVVGAIMVAAPFALNLPEKTANAREIGDVALGGLPAEQAAATRANVNTLVGMVEQTRKELVPTLARRLGVTPAELQASLARDYPALGTFLREYDALLPRTLRVVAAQEASVGDFAKADAIPVKALPWLVVVPGLLLTVVSGAILVAVRRPKVDASLPDALADGREPRNGAPGARSSAVSAPAP